MNAHNTPDYAPMGAEEVKRALRDLAAMQTKHWADFSQGSDTVFAAAIEAHDVLRLALGCEPDPESAVERYRLDDFQGPGVDGCESAALEAMGRINLLLELMMQASKSLNQCMAAVAEERRLLSKA